MRSGRVRPRDRKWQRRVCRRCSWRFPLVCPARLHANSGRAHNNFRNAGMFRRRAEERGHQEVNTKRALGRAAGTPHVSLPMAAYRSLSFAQTSQGAMRSRTPPRMTCRAGGQREQAGTLKYSVRPTTRWFRSGPLRTAVTAPKKRRVAYQADRRTLGILVCVSGVMISPRQDRGEVKWPETVFVLRHRRTRALWSARCVTLRSRKDGISNGSGEIIGGDSIVGRTGSSPRRHASIARTPSYGERYPKRCHAVSAEVWRGRYRAAPNSPVNAPYLRGARGVGGGAAQQCGAARAFAGA